jgi:hypothetical protein
MARLEEWLPRARRFRARRVHRIRLIGLLCRFNKKAGVMIDAGFSLSGADCGADCGAD